MKLTVDDVIASFCAHARTAIPAQLSTPDVAALRDHLLKALKSASIFYLGDTREVEDVTGELASDLYEELREDLPLPFDDVILIGKHERSHMLDGLRSQGEFDGLPPEQVSKMEEKVTGLWWATFITRTPASLVPEDRKLSIAKANEKKLYFFLEFMYAEQYRDWKPSLLSWTAFGGHISQRQESYGLDVKEIYAGRAYTGDIEADNLKSTIYMTALISHPSNYIVKETPKLTPREERHIPKRGFPDGKRPRYIVVDHDVLVRMSDGKAHDAAEDEESRKSPIAHKRRGHWRRLADRCVHAKDRGVEKVFVRPSYIGKTEFEIGSRKYHVLLDFKPGAQAAVAQERAGS